MRMSERPCCVRWSLLESVAGKRAGWLLHATVLWERPNPFPVQ